MKIHNITLEAIKTSNLNIHQIINNRTLNTIDKNCFFLPLSSKSLLDKLEDLSVGVFLTPYNSIINNYWNQIVNAIERDKLLFNGKTRYQYENNINL